LLRSKFISAPHNSDFNIETRHNLKIRLSIGVPNDLISFKLPETRQPAWRWRQSCPWRPSVAFVDERLWGKSPAPAARQTDWRRYRKM